MDWNGMSETVENGFRFMGDEGLTWLKPGANEMVSNRAPAAAESCSSDYRKRSRYPACATASAAGAVFSSPELRMSSCSAPCLSVTIVGLK